MSNSGAIKDLENQNIRLIGHLKRKLNREINTIEDQHNGQKSELIELHKKEINDSKIENQRQILQESAKKEQVLSEIKNNLEVTKEITEKHLKNLQDESKIKTEQVQQKTSGDYERVLQEHQFDLKMLDDKYKDESYKIQRNGKNAISNMNDQLSYQYNDRKNQLLNRINYQEREFDERTKTQNRVHEQTKQNLVTKNKKELFETHQKQEVQMSKLKVNHNADIKKEDGNFRQGLKELKNFYTDKYSQNQKQYKSEADNLDNRFNNLMNDMKNRYSQELKRTDERLEDQFYQFSELRPTWRETEKGVEVKVKVPEYSKQDLQLSINKKEVVLHFNRRYSDHNKSLEGVENRLSKVETYSSRIKTGILLDPKKITTNYENGVMTYLIEKS